MILYSFVYVSVMVLVMYVLVFFNSCYRWFGFVNNSLEACVGLLVRFSSCGKSHFIFALLASHMSAGFTFFLL